MIAVAKQVVHIQENSKASSICRTRTFAHGKTNTMWTRKACLKSILTKETPTIQASIPKRDLGAILISLKNVVTQHEEKIRVEVDDLAQQSETKAPKVEQARQRNVKLEVAAM